MALRRAARRRVNNRYEEPKDDSVLVYGFHDTSRIIEESESIMMMRRNVVLPISTRAIGLMIISMSNDLAGKLKDDTDRLLRALYRVSMLQLELKLQGAMKKQCYRNVGSRKSFCDIYVSPEMAEICSQAGVLFKPTYDLIMSVGLLEKDETLYLPRVAKRKPTSEGLDPTLVLFSNLRQYVVALADKKTSKLRRHSFFSNNPLPGAVWNSEEDLKDHPLLLNPDEIMPPNYNCENLRDDFDLVMDAVQKLSPRYPQCFVDTPIDYEDNGEESMLYCSEIKNTFEKQSNFWVPEICQNTSLRHGFYYLFGEMPNPQAVMDYSVYAIRYGTCAKEYETLAFSPATAINRYFKKNSMFDECFSCVPQVSKIRIPISTRGVGFVVNKTADKFTSFIKKELQTAFRLALYRITLLLVEQKVDYTSPCQKLIIGMYNKEFPVPLSNLITVLKGRFTSGGVDYQAYIPYTTDDENYVFDPCLITFSNLRQYVLAMANPRTKASVRKYFFKYNSIPCLEWDETYPDGPLLLNADEVMPETYYKNNIHAINDWHEISMTMDKFGIYDTDYGFDEPEQAVLKKYIFKGNFTRDPSLIEEVFFPSFHMLENPMDFMHVWSPNYVKKVEAYLAMLYMLGEIPRPEAVKNFYEKYGFRLQHCAKWEWEARRPFYAY